jgi:ATP synthase
VDGVFLVYNEFVSAVTQRVTVAEMLPISPPQAQAQTDGVIAVDYLYEPGRDALLADLLPRYLATKVWRAMLESVASEHGARMSAMDNATNNAKEMIGMPLRSYAFALILALPGLAAAAAKDPAPKQVKTPPKAEPGPQGDPDVASAGKVIEFDADGTAKVVKGAEAPPSPVEMEAKGPKGAEISAAEACRQRVLAQCAVIKRCLPSNGDLPLPCDLMAQSCDELTGKAPFPRKALEACAQGIAALKCGASAAQSEQVLMRPESAVPACKPVLDAEAAPAGGAPAGGEPETPARPQDKKSSEGSGGADP